MKALVTGGAGFIGSHVTDALVSDEHEVVVLDNLSTGFRRNVNPDARLAEVDLRDSSAVDALIAKFRPEIVFHLAAQIDVRRSTKDPEFDAESNIIGSLHLLQSCVRHGVGKIVYSSTVASYGEPLYLPVDEEHPVNPVCEYGVSKHTVEHYLSLYAHNYGIRYTVLRYANVYGPRQNAHGEAGVVSIFIDKISRGESPTLYGDGLPTRDYVFVGDVAMANVIAADRGDFGIFNIGTGTQTSVVEIFEILRRELNSPVEPCFAPLRLGEIEHMWLDLQKAELELGWSACCTLHDGLRTTVESYMRFAENQKSLETASASVSQ